MGPGYPQAGALAPSSGWELLEREESASTLGAMFAAVRKDSEGLLLWVGGEAGVGKTSLLRSFCETKASQARLLWGACQPLHTPRPLGPLVDVAAAAGGRIGQIVTADARPHEVAAALLDELAGRSSTVLVLEDLHWADEATLDVVSLLSARIGSVPTLLIASYRDDELDRAPGLRVLLGELARRPARLKLQPLSRAAVAALAEPRRLDADELYRRTGGNPFFVTEVLAAGGEQIPETVRDAVLARASRLPEDARLLLDAVAVVPGQVELWLLEMLAPEHIEHLEECLAAGVLSGGPAHVGFRHELARLALEEAISPTRRVGLHRVALRALASHADADPARLAHHAEAAGSAEQVLEWAPRAAERAAASGAHREAAGQYERALRFATGLPLAERAALAEFHARECYLSAQIEEAITAQRTALDFHRRRGDLLREGDALRELARMLFFVGWTTEGEDAILEAVELLERLPAGRELAIAYCSVSQRRMVVERDQDALTWGARALELAERLDDAEVRVYALTNIGSAEFRAGDDAGLTKLELALELARLNGLEEHAGRIFQSLVIWSLRRRQLEVVARYVEPGLQFCSERGLDMWRLYLLADRALLELHQGRWDAATDTAASVLRDPHSATVARNTALVVLGLIRARRGDAEAASALEQAWALAEPTGELMRIGPTAAARAELAWLHGDREGVVGATDAALALALDRGASWVVGELAYWRWQAGMQDEIADEQLAEPYRLEMAGDWTGASRCWRELGCPYEAALSLAAGDDDALRQAHEELQGLGARPAAAIVARRLRERGIRSVPRGPRRSTRENPAGLTARELEVLALLADGLRNAQIAERLVVSEKTVDHHVSAILRKLDVRSRGEAAAQAHRLGLVD